MAGKAYERCPRSFCLLQVQRATGAGTRRNEMAQKIMVIDDDPGIREVLTLFLQKFGFEPMVFDNAISALECLATDRPSLILLDLVMEPMNGLQFLEELSKRHARDTKIPVLILSAYGLPEEDRNRHRDWISGVLKKPILPADLRREIETRL